MFLVSAPDPDDDNQVCYAIMSLRLSARLRSLLERWSSVEKAITAYKTLILQNLTASLSQSTVARAVSEEQDDDLFEPFFPSSQLRQWISTLTSLVKIGRLRKMR